DLEMFTSVTVTFEFDYAGNVEGSVSMVTYKDVILTSAENFVGCLLTTCIGAGISATLLTVHLLRHREQCNWGLTCYEIFSRILLVVYPTILLISWSQQMLMSHEFDLLLQTFIGSDGVDDEHMKHNMQEYFKVKTVIYDEVGWLERHRVASYVLMYFQFLQMVLYFNAHPRVAMLTKTVKGALLNMLHFFLVFTILFLMLAFMAHFLLGGQIQLFGTFGGSCETQVRMLFGEFIFVDGAENLSGLSLAMYWLYAASFMLIVFFTLLNFFLAIVVDAFVAVKDEYDKLFCTYNFCYDLGTIPRCVYTHFKLKLPGRKPFIKYLEESVQHLKEVKKQEEQAKRKVGHKGVRKPAPAPAADPSLPLLLPAKRILEEFPGFTEQSLCHLLCRVEKLSATPVIFFVEEKLDNNNEPQEVDDIPEEPSH
ncbi:pkd2, partial [Symbiodinium pilosum]